MDQITLIDPLNMHVHFRQHGMCANIAPLTAESFAGAMAMPNTVPPIKTQELLKSYAKDIEHAVRGHVFSAYYTLFFNTDLTENDFEDVLAVKLYPDGITTNSEGGVASFDDPEVRRVLSIMEELGVPLCVHGETGGFVMDREKDFLSQYKFWAETYPELTIIMEHITTKDAVQLCLEHENLHATITAHHLFITLDDVVGGMINPHNFCKPIAKRPEDRDALIEAALEINGPIPRKFMLGTDSAPHPKNKKENACGCAGVFTAPIALQLMAQLFDTHLSEPQDSLQRFVSSNAKAIYNIDPPSKTVVLKKTPFTVPEAYHGVVPFMAGKELEWSVESIA